MKKRGQTTIRIAKASNLQTAMVLWRAGLMCRGIVVPRDAGLRGLQDGGRLGMSVSRVSRLNSIRRSKASLRHAPPTTY